MQSRHTVIGSPLFAQLSTAVDGIRLSLHVLAATIWVGGQFTLGGLVPTAKRLGEDAPKQLARAFSRMMWPAFAVLLADRDLERLSRVQRPAVVVERRSRCEDRRRVGIRLRRVASHQLLEPEGPRRLGRDNRSVSHDGPGPRGVLGGLRRAEAARKRGAGQAEAAQKRGAGRAEAGRGGSGRDEAGRGGPKARAGGGAGGTSRDRQDEAPGSPLAPSSRGRRAFLSGGE